MERLEAANKVELLKDPQELEDFIETKARNILLQVHHGRLMDSHKGRRDRNRPQQQPKPYRHN